MSYSKRTLLIAAGYILPLVLIVPTYYLASRNLEEQEFVLFLMINAIYGFSVALDGGVGRATVIIFRQDIDTTEEKTLLFNAFVTSLIMFSAAAGLLVLAAHLGSLAFGLGNDWTEVIQTVFPQLYVGVLATALFLTFSAYLEAKLDFTSAFYARFFFTGSYYATLILGFALRLDIAMVFILVAATRVLTLSILTSKMSGMRISHMSLEIRYLRKIAMIGFPIFLSNIPGIIISFFERLAPIGLAGIPASKLTAYFTTIDIFSKASVVPVAVNRAVFPDIARHGLFNSRIGFYFALTAMLLLGGCALLSSFWLTPQIYQGWIAIELTDTDRLLIILMSVSWALNVNSQVFFSALQASRRSRELSVLQFVELALFLALFFFLAAEYGLVGIVIASVARNVFDAIGLVAILISEMQRSRVNRYETPPLHSHGKIGGDEI